MDFFMAVEPFLEDPSIEEHLRQFCLVLSVSLGVATLSRMFSVLRNIPYTLLLLLVGLGLAVLDVRLINLSPQLILFIFLPPLLFEAAWNLNWKSLKQYSVPVVLYAIVGVVICVGSLVALFRELGVDKKLTTVMEGESLFNDGVAVVAFNLLLGIALGLEQFDLSVTVARFLVFVGIGLGVGGLIGFGLSFLTQRFDIPLVEQSLTLVSAYGTYLVAEELGGSGVIAVVATGLILGNFGSRIGMSPRTRVVVSEFWEFMSFFINSIVFLLIGDQVEFQGLLDELDKIAIAIALMLVARAVSVFALGALSNAVTGPDMDLPLKGQVVLWWGGLRGSVSVALALSVPVVLGDRQEVISIVFGVMLFTLLVQGLTIKPLLEYLGLLGDQPLKLEYNQLTARRVALTRVLSRLQAMAVNQEFAPTAIGEPMALVEGQLAEVKDKLTQLAQQHDSIRTYASGQLREELLAIEADTYAEFIRAGQLKNTLTPLLAEVLPSPVGEGH